MKLKQLEWTRKEGYPEARIDTGWLFIVFRVMPSLQKPGMFLAEMDNCDGWCEEWIVESEAEGIDTLGKRLVDVVQELFEDA